MQLGMRGSEHWEHILHGSNSGQRPGKSGWSGLAENTTAVVWTSLYEG